ncbi:LysR family transcriptional regulator [Mariniflexile sp. AS56]|uniref:LysR family transcriptional regulator n=1 Tax=Mariniflexile sp. AS56 TaxID=3063957 RepID=UPI0026F2A6CC|nr:LysR family transcriptional regulator [Mariniflexile sp. AS56]MDO7173725.1 LysR family transcriptional regulator [Mariniflexile sp. AS56]
MEIKYFRLIKTIAEEGNMANSSRRLFLTQSALSHQLRELEERLGFKVFYRKRNTWELTEEGIELHKLAIKVLDTIDKGFEKIDFIKNGTKGAIRIGTECYFFYQRLLAFIKKMDILYPEIEVDIILDASNHPLKKILENELDIAIVHDKPCEEALFSQELFEDEIFAFAHKEHFFNTKDFVDVQQFKEAHLLIHAYPLDSIFVYSQFLKPNNVEPEQITAIPMTEVALEMVNSNMGVICKPKWALEPFKGFEDIVAKRIGKYGLKRTHFLTIRKEDKHKKYINDFISNFEEEFCFSI